MKISDVFPAFRVGNPQLTAGKNLQAQELFAKIAEKDLSDSLVVCLGPYFWKPVIYFKLGRW